MVEATVFSDPFCARDRVASPSLTAAALLGAAWVLSDAFRARCRFALRHRHDFRKPDLRTGARCLRRRLNFE